MTVRELIEKSEYCVYCALCDSNSQKRITEFCSDGFLFTMEQLDSEVKSYRVFTDEHYCITYKIYI